MKLYQLVACCFFAFLCIFVNISPAYCEDFLPLHIHPEKVYIDEVNDNAFITLHASYRGRNENASHKKLYVKIQSLGDFPAEEEEDHMGLVLPVVVQYDESVAPVTISTELETDENGFSEIKANLRKGNYQIVISYDGIEGTGWQPLRIPISGTALSSTCIIELKTKTGRRIFKPGEEIAFHLDNSFSCHFAHYYAEFDDGLNKTTVTINSNYPHFKYKSERKGNFPVSLKINTKKPNDSSSEQSGYLINHPSPSSLEILLNAHVMHSYDEDSIVYYYENDLINPVPHLSYNLSSKSIRYDAVSNELGSIISSEHLLLDLYDENGKYLTTLTQNTLHQENSATFDIPNDLNGTIKPVLYLDKGVYFQTLPSFILKTDYIRTLGLAFLIILVIAFLRFLIVKFSNSETQQNETKFDIEKIGF